MPPSGLREHAENPGLGNSTAIKVAPGVLLWRERFSKEAQKTLLDTVLAGVERAPFYRPAMPGSGKAFSVEETNFGPLGWVADKSGYRYQATHPVTGAPWPDIPETLQQLWEQITGPASPAWAQPIGGGGGWSIAAAYGRPSGQRRPEGEFQPQCCLVNLYRAGARMGLHQDKDEAATAAPVVSVSLGDDAVFRIGRPERGGPTRSLKLQSGDVVMFGGEARLAYHGIDRIIAGTSTLVQGGGRINLTLRRVTA